MVKKLHPWILIVIVTISGFCSLIYQVIWERTVRYNFGGDSVSLAVVTGTFLFGLGLGAYGFGRWFRHSFFVYATIELGIGFYAMGSYLFLSNLAPFLGSLFQTPIENVEGLRASVIWGCILFLIPPCILMGGTLPLMFNCFIRPGNYKTRMVGIIYGFNTIGGGFGILAAPFFFLNRFPIPFILKMIGAVNIFLGLVIGWQGIKNQEKNPRPQWFKEEDQASFHGIYLLVLGFISGFILITYEVSLFRAIFIKNPSSAYNYPLVLGPFLISMALGSLIFSQFKEFTPTIALKRIGTLFSVSVWSMILGIFLSEKFFHLNVFWHIAFLSIFMPLLLGGVFPLLLRLQSARGQDLPKNTGPLYLSNSFGAFSGVLISQFLGYPLLGTKGVLLSIFILGLSTSATCWIKSVVHWKFRVWASLIMMIFFFLIPQTFWNFYIFGLSNYQKRVVDGIEGPTGVATVEWRDGIAIVRANNQWMSIIPDHPAHVKLVSYALTQPHFENTLVLGIGGGGMVYKLAHHPKVKRVDIVDWSYELPLIQKIPEINQFHDNLLNHPKVHLYQTDARVAVSLYQSDTFDTIIDNLAFAHWLGATSIKSIEYFQKLKRILKPSGILVFRISGEKDTARMAILAGLTASFKFVMEHKKSEVLASDQPITIDPDLAESFLALDTISVERARRLYGKWLYDPLVPIHLEFFKKVQPIHDDFLKFEFFLNPF